MALGSCLLIALLLALGFYKKVRTHFLWGKKKTCILIKIKSTPVSEVPLYSSGIQSWVGQEILYCVVFKFNIRRCLSLLGVRTSQVKTKFEEFCETFSLIILRFSSHSCERGTSVFKDSQATPVSEVLRIKCLI